MFYDSRTFTFSCDAYRKRNIGVNLIEETVVLNRSIGFVQTLKREPGIELIYFMQFAYEEGSYEDPSNYLLFHRVTCNMYFVVG